MATVLQPSVAPIFLNGELEDDFVLHIPRDAYTLAGFRRWVLSDEFPEKQPVMFLNGEIFLYMPKEDVFTHAAVKTPVAVELGGLFRDLDLGNFFINGVLVTNVEADVSNNPDMVGILWESLESGKVRYVTNKKDRTVEIEGTPDWLVEIVSDGSVRKDMYDLRAAYHKAGVLNTGSSTRTATRSSFKSCTGARPATPPPRVKPTGNARAFSAAASSSRARRGDWRYVLAVKEP
jgi:Uma2 family endonuclease